MEEAKVLFTLVSYKLEDDVMWPPYSVETLWAERLAPGRMRLLNSPFFAKGVSYLDEVFVNLKDDGLFAFLKVAKRSGHGTVRALLRDDNQQIAAEEAVAATATLGCATEWGGAVASIDVPPDISASRILEVLSKARDQGAIYID